MTRDHGGFAADDPASEFLKDARLYIATAMMVEIVVRCGSNWRGDVGSSGSRREELSLLGGGPEPHPEPQPKPKPEPKPEPKHEC